MACSMLLADSTAELKIGVINKESLGWNDRTTLTPREKYEVWGVPDVIPGHRTVFNDWKPDEPN